MDYLFNNFSEFLVKNDSIFFYLPNYSINAEDLIFFPNTLLF